MSGSVVIIQQKAQASARAFCCFDYTLPGSKALNVPYVMIRSLIELDGK